MTATPASAGRAIPAALVVPHVPHVPHVSHVPHVLPASHRPGYDGAVHTRLVDRAALLPLARRAAALRGADLGTPTLTDPALGTAVAWRAGRVWRFGIVETTGRAGVRAAYVELARPDHVRRARLTSCRGVPTTKGSR